MIPAMDLTFAIGDSKPTHLVKAFRLNLKRYSDLSSESNYISTSSTLEGPQRFLPLLSRATTRLRTAMQNEIRANPSADLPQQTAHARRDSYPRNSTGHTLNSQTRPSTNCCRDHDRKLH